MLVKVSDDTIEWWWTVEIRKNVKYASQSTVSPYYTFSKSYSSITIRTVASYSTYDNWFNLALYNASWTQIQSSINVLPYSWSENTRETTINNIEAWYYLSCYTNKWWTYTTTITWPNVISKDKWAVWWYPTEISDIWNKIFITLYWNNNWEYVWWIITWKSNSVLVWNITPWNFVWYIKVNFNWEIIKIPYYN